MGLDYSVFMSASLNFLMSYPGETKHSRERVVVALNLLHAKEIRQQWWIQIMERCEEMHWLFDHWNNADTVPHTIILLVTDWQ